VRIYADTSFLVELLYKGATHHITTRQFFTRHAEAEWITTEWLQFEVSNTLRQLCLYQPGIKPAQAEALRRLLKHWHARGNFVFEETNLSEAVKEAMQLSAATATKLRMRSADVLHVALLEQINPDLFVTRDKDQYKLAVSRALKSQLLP
jgi:predicted nucleic acid-binding protein